MRMTVFHRSDICSTPFQFVMLLKLHRSLSLFSTFAFMPLTPHFTLPSFPNLSPFSFPSTFLHSPLHSPVIPAHSPSLSFRSHAVPLILVYRSVSVSQGGGGTWLRQCWSTTLTRSLSLAALLWVTLSCRQQPSTSLQSSWSPEERARGWGDLCRDE